MPHSTQDHPVAVATAPPAPLRIPRAWEWVLVALLVIVGTVLRARDLDKPQMTIDESESAINALTILQHGVPVDEYLGLPLYENTLTRPWPDHPEYEFRDTSYSDRGYAVYHGWLPLYSIAASFAIAGIEPDLPSEPPTVKYSTREMSVRAIAARAPSLVFGAVFMIVAFAAGKSLYGSDAGWIALILAMLAEPSFEMSRAARYYVSTVAIATICCLAIWNLHRHGRWRDYLVGGIALGLLFHTHILTFFVGAAVLAASVPWLIRQPRWWRKLGTLGAIVVVAVLPWMIGTGFIGHTTDIPSARSLLKFPDDYLAYFRAYPVFVAILAAAALAVVIGVLLARRRPSPVEPLRQAAAPIALLGGWMIAGYLAFVLLMPAASFFLYRMTYPIMGPMLVLAAILCAAAGRLFLRRYALVMPLLVLAAMVVFGRGGFLPRHSPLSHSSTYATIDYLRSLDLEPGTRIYSLPYEHLTLTFYTGLPVQSIAPVRRSFLDSYGHDVLILETVNRYPLLTARSILDAAAAEGVTISKEQALAYQDRYNSVARREDLVGHVAQVEPALEPVPSFVRRAIDQQRAAAERPQKGRPDALWGNPAIFRGSDIPSRWGFWSVFFYRFVDPASRSDANVNYAGRIRTAKAVVLPWDWVVYHCPPPASENLR